MAKVLVVDDEALICDLLRQVLTHHGYEVVTALNGREALERFEQQRPEVTLLDLHMPRMSGIEVLTRMREIDPRASVMVLTGCITDTLEHQARALGVTEFLLKESLSLDVLVGAVGRKTRYPAAFRQEAVPFAAALAETGRESLILVVDDEPKIRDILTQFLTLRGYRVRAAQNGVEALALVDRERPQLIILDVYMPGIDGVEVLRELRNRKKYVGGVIMLTASQDQALLQQAWTLGSINVLGKPIDLGRLALVIYTALAFIGIQPPTQTKN